VINEAREFFTFSAARQPRGRLRRARSSRADAGIGVLMAIAESDPEAHPPR